MATKKKTEIEEKFLLRPLLALDQTVITPLIPQPVKIDHEEHQSFLNNCTNSNSEIFIATAVASDEEPSKSKILEVGTLAIVDRILQMPGAPSMAFIRPVARAKYLETVFNPVCPMAKVVPIKNIVPPKRVSPNINLTVERIEELFKSVMQYAGEPERMTAQKIIEENSIDLLHHIYAIVHVAPLSWEEKYQLVKSSSFSSLIDSLAKTLDIADQRISLQAKIHERTHIELTQQQKENFLRVHLKQVQEELGESEDNEISELIVKANQKKWPDEARKHFDKELQKIRRLNVNNPEYSVQFSYLEALLELPWENYQKTKVSIDNVEKILNRDHFGLEKVKERILEYMAVVKLRDDLKAPILCLYGPPGVGKTSIGKSVAEAVGREYARISLGGMHDEAEIRGHRRTYIGAMPGRFLHTLSKLKYGNPLILLDEIDKVGKDFKGDPSSALLEALDPEQNNTFHDNFIDYPYDLSKVLFIATANDLNTIPAPLRDRMEIIEMPAYKTEEKKEIALRHLVKQALTENGFKEDEISFTPEAVEAIIKGFTHESGVRQLKLQISKIIRKLALMKVRGKKLPDEITGKLVGELLDKRDSGFNSLGFRG